MLIQTYTDSKGSECKIRLFDIKEEPEHEFLVEDTLAFMRQFGVSSDIVEIYSIVVLPENRNKGLGGHLLDLVLSEKQNSLKIVEAGAHVKEYEAEEYRDNLDFILNSLDRFYTKHGFITINDVIGCYDEACAYLYIGNKIGIEFMEKLIKHHFAGASEFISSRKFIERESTRKFIEVNDLCLKSL